MANLFKAAEKGNIYDARQYVREEDINYKGEVRYMRVQILTTATPLL